MSRTVHCSRLKQDLPGLPAPPFPGTRGEEIFQTGSAQAWADWQEQQTMLINEKRLNLRDKQARTWLNAQRDRFLAGEAIEQAEGYIAPE